jgi:hypothetical protein
MLFGFFISQVSHFLYDKRGQNSNLIFSQGAEGRPIFKLCIDFRFLSEKLTSVIRSGYRKNSLYYLKGHLNRIE